MSEQRRIEQLNRVLGQTFGYISFGDKGMRPKYAWLHTTAQDYWVHDGVMGDDGKFSPKRDVVAMPSGVLATIPIYKRESWATMYGPCWILAVRKPPIPESLHLHLYGGGVPWARHGDYQPIETFRVVTGKAPTEDANALAMYVLRQNLGMKLEDHEREGEEIHEQETNEKLTRIGDEMDDMLDAPTLRVGKGSWGLGGGEALVKEA